MDARYPGSGWPRAGDEGAAPTTLSSPDARLEDLLGVLSSALETLQLTKTRRLLALLDVAAEETEGPRRGRYSFYARACRAMFALVEGDLVGASRMADEAEQIGRDAVVHEAFVVVRSLRNERARQLGDRDGLATGAAACEADGSLAALAEAAVLWLESGQKAQAGRLVDRLTEHGTERIAAVIDQRERILVAARLCEAAVGCGRRVAAASCARLLAPYAGRAIVSGRATVFAGVVEDYLALATGEPETARRARAAYQELGAWWWARRRALDLQPSTSLPRVVHLHPSHRTTAVAEWCVGPDGQTRMVTAMPGLGYLRRLLQRPGEDLTAAELSGEATRDPRHRIMVRQAIAAALARLEMQDPDLAHDLRSTIRTGLTCRYDPDPLRPTAWHLDVDVLHAAMPRSR